MKAEEIKWIEGYEGMYIITSYGRVYSVVRRDKYCRISGGGEIKQALTATGYHFVSLYKKGKGVQEYVHQLVARAFIPNPENKNCVDHIDNNKSNNNVDNLRWVTHKENMNNTITKMRMINESAKYISQVGSDNPFSRKIEVRTVDGTFVGVYESAGEAARALKIANSNSIGRVARGERPQSHGYVFKYLSEAKMKIDKRPDHSYARKPIIKLDLNDNVVAEYDCIRDAAKELGVHSSNIGKAARGEFKTCGGYKWRYK